jgi:hypothetical protein
MTRTSHYYGRICGASVVEKRRGTISLVTTGAVDRFYGEEAQLRGQLRFKPEFPVTGVRAKRLADALSWCILEQAKGRMTAEQSMDAIDQAICQL